MKIIKQSRQRTAIKEFLATRKDHPTADVVYNSVREIYPNISLGTVYRNLSLLTDLGEIQKLSCGDNAEHFDGNISLHNHFVCKHCNAVIDLDMIDINFISTLAGCNFDGEIHGHNTMFYGLCADCKNDKI